MSKPHDLPPEPPAALPPEVESELQEVLDGEWVDREAGARTLLARHPEFAAALRVRLEAEDPDDEGGDTVASGDDRFDWHDPPAKIGPYRILATLGTGGMGVVYLAEQQVPIHRDVALKVIKLGMDSREVLARFDVERQALAMMNHPGIAKVFDAGVSEEGQPYFVMEYARGVPLSTFCDEHQLTLTGRIHIFLQICMAVQHAHQKGVLHRDLKPANILCTRDGMQPVIKIIDFGLARATDQTVVERSLYTEQGKIIGTPEYMSPEQARGDATAIDTRTDIYSLGVILYQLLTGVLPFRSAELRRAGLMEVYRLIQDGDPGRPSSRVSVTQHGTRGRARDRQTSPAGLRRALLGDLDWIVMRAIAKEPDRRYDSATALAMDLRRYLRHEPVEAGPPGAGYRVGRFVRRFRIQLVASAMVVAVLVASVLMVWSYAVDAWEQLAIARDAVALAQDKEKEARDNLALARSAEQHSTALDREVQRWRAEAERAEVARRRVEADRARLREDLDHAAATAAKREVEAQRAEQKIGSLEFRNQESREASELRGRRLRQQRHLVTASRLSRARSIEREFGPEWPQAREAATSWMVEATSILAERTGLEAQLAAGPESPKDPRVGAIADLVSELRAFGGPAGEVARTERRLVWLEAVESLTVDAPAVAAAWEYARASLGDVDGRVTNSCYRQVPVDLTPQTGLLPLGPHPRTGMWEFYHPRSGWAVGTAPAALPLPPLADPSRRYTGRLPVACTGMVLVLIPGQAVSTPRGRRPRIAPFFLAKHELTQEQWLNLAGRPSPSTFQPGATAGNTSIDERHPVESVTWNECVELLHRHGLTLPTEVEWEFGARGGAARDEARDPTRWLRTGAKPAGNIHDRSAGETFPGTPANFVDGYRYHAPVGSYPANGFGLFDTIGNVAEWCLDAFVLDPGASPPRENRAFRGGSYRSAAEQARPGWRSGALVSNRDPARGLRPSRRLR